jgi:hypothetical protein
VHVKRNAAMSAYAAMVGTPPADMSDVKATWLGMMESSIMAAKTNMTVTAFLGCRLLSTRPIQLESGSTPSRATANRSREQATTAILVFYGAVRTMSMINMGERPIYV